MESIREIIGVILVIWVALSDVADTQVDILQEAELLVDRRMLSYDNTGDYA